MGHDPRPMQHSGAADYADRHLPRQEVLKTSLEALIRSRPMPNPPPTIALALQGGGSHGALHLGRSRPSPPRYRRRSPPPRRHQRHQRRRYQRRPHRQRPHPGRFRPRPAEARRFLARASRAAASWRATRFFYGEPGPFGGFNLDWSPVAIALEAAGLVVSPYSNPFYTDALAPLLAQAFPPPSWQRSTPPPGRACSSPPRTWPATAGRSSPSPTSRPPRSAPPPACRPSSRPSPSAACPTGTAAISAIPRSRPCSTTRRTWSSSWSNPLHRDAMPPRTARGILDRLNEITFNASVVLEMNAIEAINSLLAELAASGVPYAGRYKPIRLHAVRNDAFAEQLGFVSKNSTSWTFLSALHDAGYQHGGCVAGRAPGRFGGRSSLDVKAELTDKVLKRGPRHRRADGGRRADRFPLGRPASCGQLKPRKPGTSEIERRRRAICRGPAKAAPCGDRPRAAVPAPLRPTGPAHHRRAARRSATRTAFRCGRDPTGRHSAGWPGRVTA